MSDILLVKREIINTTATRGWRLISDRAEAVIVDLMSKALDESDKAKRDELVAQARAARIFWRELLQSLESSKSAETDADGWYEIADQ